MPQLPNQVTTGDTSQGLTHTTFVNSGPFAVSSAHDAYQYAVTSSMDSGHENYGTHQHQHQAVMPSYGSSGYGYEWQQSPQDHVRQHYEGSNLRSLSISSSHYDMSQAQQPYSTQVTQDSQSPPMTGCSLYEPMAIDGQDYQAHSVVSGANDAYTDYLPYSRNQQQFVMQNSQNNLRDLFEQYHNQTKEIFTLVSERRIRPAASLLLQISRFLIGNVEALGLDRDDRNQHGERLKLWDTFNQCWLTALQMQYKMTAFIASTGQQLSSEQSVMDADTLEALGQELVRLCDGIEKSGLVDYQMGVAEEHIVEREILSLLVPENC